MTSLALAIQKCWELRDQSRRMASYQQDDLDFLAYTIQYGHLSNAQIFQDLWVLFELGEKRDGYFVEFGACDGIKYSNTYMLETLYGWRGALAEPAKIWHNELLLNRSAYISRDCIYAKTGDSVVFNETDVPAVSTIHTFSFGDEHAEVRQHGKQYDVRTISLMDFLASARAPAEIDYLSIDTEGSEFDILEKLDFNAYRIKLISVEHNYTPMREAIFELLLSKGYRRKFPAFSRFDDWYVLS